jgi:hypothetical protein
MNIKKITALCLWLAIMLSLLCSCDLLSNLADTIEEIKSKKLNDSDSEESGKNTGMPMIYSAYCYTITCGSETLQNAKTYNFGDEITVSLKLQLNSHSNTADNPLLFETVKIWFSIEESPSFQLLSDPIVTYNSITTDDYICDKKSGNYLIADFKVKINEPEFKVNTIDISVSYEHTEHPDDPALFRTYTSTTKLNHVHYITDSQGIIINATTTCSNHHIKRNTPDELRVLSYNREYLNGVALDKLIDKYIEAEYGENVFCNYRKISKETRISLFKRERKISYEIIYVSKDLRFKLYLDESPRENNNVYSKPEYARSALQIALKYKVITQAEYENEIYRIENTAKYSESGIYSDNIVAEFYDELFVYGTIFQNRVNSDDYFNYVLDTREDW